MCYCFNTKKKSAVLVSFPKRLKIASLIVSQVTVQQSAAELRQALPLFDRKIVRQRNEVPGATINQKHFTVRASHWNKNMKPDVRPYCQFSQ